MNHVDTEQKKKPIVERTWDGIISQAKKFISIFEDGSTALQLIATFIGVAGCVLIVFRTLQPELIFTDTTPTGGDMGAHVWWPAYMRDVLIPSGRIFGWTMDYYSGFPVGQYYFPIPALMIVILDILLPYNIAFKFITVIGSVALPVCAYVMGRNIRAPKPIPMLMAFAATAFLYFTGDPRADTTGTTLVNYATANFNHHIMGGPLLSAMAGEFSFSIALSFSLLFLGAFYVSVRDGSKRTRVAILFALTIMSHLVVAIFAGLAAIVFWGSVYVSRKGYFRLLGAALLSWIAIVSLSMGAIGEYFFDHEFSPVIFLIFGITAAIVLILAYGFTREGLSEKAWTFVTDMLPLIVGMLLSAIWLLPLFLRFGYTSNMRYEKLVDLPSTPGINEVYELYISPSYFMWPVFVPAAIGFILSATLLRKSIIPLIVTAAVMGTVFVMWPEGHAWNLRFLPFWYLFIFFVAAVGYGELARLPSSILGRMAFTQKNRAMLESAKWLRSFTTVFLVLMFFALLMGVGSESEAATGASADTRFFKDRRGFADGWAKYNFEGYEGRGNSWTEFENVLNEMDKLEPGRALWEPSEGAYGTTLALTMLPYFTDRKIASQEGLYYEAAGFTGYHFLNVAEVSKTPSNPMRWPKCEVNPDGSKKDLDCFDSYYGTISDFRRGVEHMRMSGVRYFMAHSVEAKQAAQDHEDLELVTSIADADGTNPLGWDVYEIRNHGIVVGLANDPVVITDRGETKDWQQSGNKWLFDWWNRPGDYPVFVNDGPEEWSRKTATEALADPLTSQELEKESDVKVSNVNLQNDSISFSVDKVGEPVMVRVSYYPSFAVSGAEEIYRASPNFMVVVPTEKDVTIEIKRDSGEWISIFLFLVGIAGVVGLIYLDRGRFSLASMRRKPKD
jgi:hypothetical protein